MFESALTDLSTLIEGLPESDTKTRMLRLTPRLVPGKWYTAEYQLIHLAQRLPEPDKTTITYAIYGVRKSAFEHYSV